MYQRHWWHRKLTPMYRYSVFMDDYCSKRWRSFPWWQWILVLSNHSCVSHVYYYFFGYLFHHHILLEIGCKFYIFLVLVYFIKLVHLRRSSCKGTKNYILEEVIHIYIFLKTWKINAHLGKYVLAINNYNW